MSIFFQKIDSLLISLKSLSFSKLSFFGAFHRHSNAFELLQNSLISAKNLEKQTNVYNHEHNFSIKHLNYMKNYLKQDHIARLISKNLIQVIPEDQAREIFDSINNFPWQRTRLDFKKISKHTVDINLAKASDSEWSTFCRSIKQKTDALILIYDSKQAVIGETLWVLKEFDTLCWKAPGLRYFLGATLSVPIQPIFDVIIEYDGMDRLKTVF